MPDYFLSANGTASEVILELRAPASGGDPVKKCITYPHVLEGIDRLKETDVSLRCGL